MPIIIGICGKKYHGKDTIADYLVKNFHFAKISLGDPLKEALQNIFGFTDDQLWGDKKETVDPYWNTTPRELMQFIGTDLMRIHLAEKFPSIGQSVWVMSLEKHINNMIANGVQRIVVPDMRFPNEELVVRKFGGFVIRVERPECESHDTHVSENSSKDIYADATIINTKFDKLYSDTEEVLRKLCPSMFQDIVFNPQWD
jgi:hypothetical protein